MSMSMGIGLRLGGRRASAGGGAPPTLITTTSATSFTDALSGVTWLSRTSAVDDTPKLATWGQFLNGDPFIIAGGAVFVDTDLPRTEVTETIAKARKSSTGGYNFASGVSGVTVNNGMWKNPWTGSSTDGLSPQGFTNIAANGTAETATYDPALDIDPAYTGVNILCDSEFTLEKHITKPTGSGYADGTATVGYATLTVLSDVPVVGTMRPPRRGATKTRFVYSDAAAQATLGNYTFPTTAPVPDAAKLAKLQTPQQTHVTNGEKGRSWWPTQGLDSYGEDWCADIMQPMLWLQSDIAYATKREFDIAMVQIGIDLWGAANDGGVWQSNGGHHHGRQILVVRALLACNAAATMGTIAADPLIWQADVGYYGYVWAGAVGTEYAISNASWPLEWDAPTAGLADWNPPLAGDDPLVAHRSNDFGMRYRGNNVLRNYGLTAAAHAMGATAYFSDAMIRTYDRIDAILQGDLAGTWATTGSNDPPFSLTDDTSWGTYANPDWMIAAYPVVRAATGTPFTTIPEAMAAPVVTAVADGSFTAAINANNFLCSRLPILGYRVQWRPVVDQAGAAAREFTYRTWTFTAESATLPITIPAADLPGDATRIELMLQARNADGWSSTPYASRRTRGQATATAATYASNRHATVIALTSVVKAPFWYDIAATLELSAGLTWKVGVQIDEATPALFVGSAVTAREYRWLRDGVAIGGATSASYTPVVADIGAVLVREEQAQSSGGAWSAWVPTAATPVIESASATTIPTVTGVDGTTSITGVTVAWPAGHAANDIALFIVETAVSVAIGATPTGGTIITTTDASGTNNNRMTVGWVRATSGAEAALDFGTVAGHQNARVIFVRGCVATGSPIDAFNATTTSFAVLGDPVTIAGVTTTVANTLVIMAATFGNDTSTDPINAATWAAAGLSSVTGQINNCSSTGGGGGVAAMTGGKAAAGATGSATATTTVNPGVNATIALALIPA